jgi:hypothetical protein
VRTVQLVFTADEAAQLARQVLGRPERWLRGERCSLTSSARGRLDYARALCSAEVQRTRELEHRRRPRCCASPSLQGGDRGGAQADALDKASDRAANGESAPAVSANDRRLRL